MKLCVPAGTITDKQCAMKDKDNSQYMWLSQKHLEVHHLLTFTTVEALLKYANGILDMNDLIVVVIGVEFMQSGQSTNSERDQQYIFLIQIVLIPSSQQQYIGFKTHCRLHEFIWYELLHHFRKHDKLLNIKLSGQTYQSPD